MPLPPPTSTIVPKRPKSYAPRRDAFAARVSAVIARSKIALSSGRVLRYSQTSMPCSRRNAFSPVRTLSARAPHVCQWCGRPTNRAQPASDSGVSLRRQSESGVSENRPLKLEIDFQGETGDITLDI